MESWIKPYNVKRRKKLYKKGTRVRFVYARDPFVHLEGQCGTVEYVDDEATIHVLWDNGERYGIGFGRDVCERLDNKKK